RGRDIDDRVADKKRPFRDATGHPAKLRQAARIWLPGRERIAADDHPETKCHPEPVEHATAQALELIREDSQRDPSLVEADERLLDTRIEHRIVEQMVVVVREEPAHALVDHNRIGVRHGALDETTDTL